MTLSPEEAVERLGPYRFIHKRGGLGGHQVGHPLTNDPFLLTDFILPLKEHDSVIDLGTGTGIIPILLAWKSDVRSITGVEVERGVFQTARKNVDMNGLGHRVKLIEDDYRNLPGILPPGSFSVVLSNPPYIKKGHGRRSPVRQRAVARAEVKGTLEDLLEVSRYLLTEEGRLFYIYPVRRLEEVLEGIRRLDLKPRRLRFVHTAAGEKARLFLVEAGRSGTLKMDEPVFL